MNVVYITIIGLLAVIAGWLAQALKEAKENLAKAEADKAATEEGMDEMASMMYDQLLTIGESQDQAALDREIITKYSEQVVELEEQVGRLETENAEQKQQLLLLDQVASGYLQRIGDLNGLLNAAQARARDLEEIVTFHANNCLPVLEHIRAANG